VVQGGTWEEFVLSFPERYRSPEEFREACYAVAGRREQRRATDLETKTPLSPYNLRLYCQTYFGIRDVLAPLQRGQLASVLPMEKALPGRLWLLEVCPAATLKREGLYGPYKGARKEHRLACETILHGTEETGPLFFREPTLRRAVVDDPGGDAIDSVVAAFAVLRAICSPGGLVARDSDAYALEGYVYV
jgi:hypothetical protein